MSKITKDSILSTFPLASDKDQLALAQAVADHLVDLYRDTDLLSIYARIDELPEELLDILAYDFKIDWWDKGFTVAEKRQLMKDSWEVHRHLGTKGSVETAISAIYNTKVCDWYEYDGRPYHYKLEVDTESFPDAVSYQRIVNKNRYYANLRSILDAIRFIVTYKLDTLYFGIVFAERKTSSVTFEIPEITDDFLVDEDGTTLLDELGIVLTE